MAATVGAPASDRAAAATEMVKAPVVAVAVALSVTVTEIVESPAVVGVPEMTPVELFNERPAGKLPDAIA